jgi:prepilin signal peptidase PulO-like enzyme (type II secretory pathway)
MQDLLAFVLVFAGVLGLVMGSFLTCVAWRLVRGESWVSGRSHCDECGHELGMRDLVPVVSWVASRGRCRYCGAHISARNPICELLCAVVYVLMLWRYGPTAEALEMLAFASVLLVIALVDLDSYTIPNGCIACLVAIRAAYLAYLWATGEDVASLALSLLVGALGMTLALLALVLVMDRVLGKESMGFGDLKLICAAGLYFGWLQLLFLLVLACILGICSAPLARHLAQRIERPEGVSEGGFPFGPSIACSCVITALVGGQFAAWYLSLLV